MLQEHAKLMKMLFEAGEIVGRKKLQKMVYIAKKMELPFYEKYHFHFFGPYSEELTLRLEELENLGFLSEVKEKKGGYVQYRYMLTDTGAQFLHQYEVNIPPLKECVSKMNDQSSRFLELVSTMLFFDHLDQDQVKEKVHTLKAKQRYTEEELEEARQFIHDMGEISRTMLSS